MAFARNPAARHVGFRLESPSILRVASTGESTTRRRTRAGSQSTNKLYGRRPTRFPLGTRGGSNARAKRAQRADSSC